MRERKREREREREQKMERKRGRERERARESERERGRKREIKGWRAAMEADSRQPASELGPTKHDHSKIMIPGGSPWG